MFFVRCLIPVTFKKDSSKHPEYRVVLANSSFVTVNSASYPDRTFSAHVQCKLWYLSSLPFPLLVFWALRGGGAGSWGVIIDATLRTFPIFNATIHIVNVLTATLDQTGDLMTTHAMHIKDWDAVRAGQYFLLTGSTSNSSLFIATIFKDLDGDASKAQMASFLDDVRALGAVAQGETTATALANDLAVSAAPDDSSGTDVILSSRLIPYSVYLNAPSNISTAYKQLLSLGVPAILGHLVAGGVFVPFFLPVSHVHHPLRPSRRQRQYQLGNHPRVALG